MALNEKQILEKVNSQFVVSIELPMLSSLLTCWALSLVGSDLSSISCYRKGAGSWFFSLCTLVLLHAPLPSLILVSGLWEIHWARCLFLPWEHNTFYSLDLHQGCIRLSYFYPAWLPEFPMSGREALGGDWRRFNPNRLASRSIEPVTWSWSAWRRAFLSPASSCVSLKTSLRFKKKKKEKGVVSSASVMFFILILGNTVNTTDARCLLTSGRSKDNGTCLKVMDSFWVVWSFLGHPPEPRRGDADLHASVMVCLITAGLGYLGLPGNLLRWWGFDSYSAEQCSRRCRFPWLLRFLFCGKACLELACLSSLWSYLSINLEGFWWWIGWIQQIHL